MVVRAEISGPVDGTPTGGRSSAALHAVASVTAASRQTVDAFMDQFDARVAGA
jgi:hypothetical protein